ncbi:hypothetical protein BYT27DRAFT_7221475 [Phlegmacium glaucopus]|nr:hypothetical protein BYT27DRAFT_7221475 [Phlegmacium glaucopus]
MTSSFESEQVLRIDQAQQIVRAYLSGHSQSVVKTLSQIENTGFSYTPAYRTYILDLDSIVTPSHSTRSCSCFLMIASQITAVNESSGTNSLQLIHQIIGRIRARTDIPIPDSILDTSLEIVPFHYLLSPACPINSSNIVSLSTARQSGLLSASDNVLIDLQIGKCLGQLHSGVQNDWYGLPQLEAPEDPSYSWQESFTLLFETLLGELETASVKLPYEEIRRYLSRAIGSFLFDDVEVPSLIWFTGSDHDVYVSLPVDRAAGAGVCEIIAILPNIAHALWGDPLLETFFLPPNPSTAMLEAYSESGGGPLTVFPRQKTKRTWYTLFLALVVLKQRGYTINIGAEGFETFPMTEINQAWVTDTILKSIKSLRDAPTY